MATVLDDDKVYVSYPIAKFEEQTDGSLVVYGKATDGSVDSDEQIVDPAWSAGALKNWMDTGPNVRVQHNPKLYPAGTGMKLEVDRDGDGGHWVKSKVVEPTAKELVRVGALRAYSVGIAKAVVERDLTGKAPGGVIKGGEIFEISLVDRPANKNCSITLVKGAGVGGDWEHGDLEELLRSAQAGTVTKADGKPDDAADADAAEDAADGSADEASETDDTEDAGKASSGEAADADSEGGQPRDGADGDDTDDAEADSEDVSDADAQKAAWSAERAGWLGREPKLGKAADGTDFLAKRAEWQRWQAEGQTAGLVDDGYPLWVSKRAAPATATTDADGEAGDAAVKADKDCKECGATYHADSKLRNCSQCGADLPHAKAEQPADGDEAAEKGTGRPAGTKPAGEHREPDGDAVEALEADAGMHTDPDPAHDQVPASVKSQAPYSVVRMHDALCAAYPWDAVAAEYPSLKGLPGAVDTAWFVAEVANAAATGDMGAVAGVATVAAAAQNLAKGEVEPAVIDDARAGLYKGFAEMYPTASPTPGSVTPGQFQRPYVGAGHAPLSAGGGSPRIPAATHTPHADQFTRGPLTEDHQAPPPASQGGNNPVSSVATGAVRTFYTRASRDAARNTMQAMHDHIVQTFPDMCPLSGSHTPLPPGNGDSNRPTPNSVPESAPAPGEKTAEVTVTKADNDQLPAPVVAPVMDVDAIVKGAVAEAVARLNTTYESQIAALKAEIDELGAQPDPRQAPVRGVIRTKAATEPAPVEKVSLVEQAQAQAADERGAYIAYLKRMSSPEGPGDPSMREQASAVLEKLLSS